MSDAFDVKKHKYVKVVCTNVYDHTTMKLPVLVRSRKLSIVGPG